MDSKYELERRPFGWLLCAPPGQTGIPLTALRECLPLFPKRAVMHPGIAHHYNASGYRKHVALAIATPADAQAWAQAIAAELQDCDPQDRWWRGTDVGCSSAALFAVLCRPELRPAAAELGRAATPQDAEDLGRCQRLLAALPEWRIRLTEVALAYADTAWPIIIRRWPELEAADPQRQTLILRECHAPVPPNH